MGTTSKTLAPALRLAWMVPPAHLIDDLEDVLRVTGVTPPTLDQMAIAYFIEDAALERHLRSMRRRYRAKREILIDALSKDVPQIRVGGAPAGLHLLAWLPEGADERAIALRARRAGVGMHELHRRCMTSAPSPPGCCSATRCPASPTWSPPPGCWPRRSATDSRNEGSRSRAVVGQ